LQRVEIERNVAHRRRQDAAGRATRQIRVELVTILHPAAEFSDQLAYGDAGGREMHAGILHAPRDGKRPQTFATVTPLSGEPARAFLENVAHPEKRFHVVLERGPP